MTIIEPKEELTSELHLGIHMLCKHMRRRSGEEAKRPKISIKSYLDLVEKYNICRAQRNIRNLNCLKLRSNYWKGTI